MAGIHFNVNTEKASDPKLLQHRYLLYINHGYVSIKRVYEKIEDSVSDVVDSAFISLILTGYFAVS